MAAKRKSRKASPDYYLDPDRGTGSPAAKQAVTISPETAAQRSEEREGLRDLDQRTEALSNLTRAQKDKARLIPRPRPADLGHARKRRQLPEPGTIRVKLSKRQIDERARARGQAQAKMPATQLTAMRSLVTDPHRWHSINDELSDHVGDVEALSPKSQEEVRRIDRAIQRYERFNDRGHVVYSNVRMPPLEHEANLEETVRSNFAVGSVLSFDRYTAGSHQMHETAAADDQNTTVIFEMQTRRGGYLGGWGNSGITHHLLPRGLKLEVAGVEKAQCEAPDGSKRTRIVVQLVDITTEGEERE